MQDQVGLGWRGELAAGIFQHLDSIDVLEVIAEDWVQQPRRQQAALAALANEKALLLHGVSMGLASSQPVEIARVDHMARLCALVRPTAWSEHLAFVRAGNVEIGHLAAPPRNSATIGGAIANIELATRVIGMRPALENIATLIDPPTSVVDEAAWTTEILTGSGCPLLLDLHNLYANALNFGRDPAELLTAMPLDRVQLVHLSGGRWLRSPAGRPRLLDDHLHDVPQPVYGLLEQLATHCPVPLRVLIERDGNYPSFEALLEQLGQARTALARGRRRQLLGAAA
jgi:uncharacterized protein (UPF0276 family)